MESKYVITAFAVICIVCIICETVSTYGTKECKSAYDHICIGGYQYELVVNEFNEPVWCGENSE